MAVRYFTLDEAQAMLPTIRSMLGQALQLHAHLRTGLARLSADGHTINWSILRGEEELDDSDELSVEDLARARMIYGALREIVTELEGLGVELKSVTSGLVDFRSWCDGEREVLLCFRLGETKISHFHAPEAGFSGRESVEGHSFTATQTSSAAPRPEASGSASPSQQ